MRRSRPKKRRSWRCKVADDVLAQIRLNGAVPRHVAIIMDGNGRWARERNLPRPFGHRAGMKAVREVVEGAIEAGVDGGTLFAFLGENLAPPPPQSCRVIGTVDEANAPGGGGPPGPGGGGARRGGP